LSNITAHVDRTILVSAITRARDHWSALYEAAKEQMRLDTIAYVSAHPVGLFRWWPMSNDTAYEKLCGGWRTWKASDDCRAARNALNRLHQIVQAVDAKNISNIRLPESDLRLLKDFLNG
jgi:hypothetical protein